MRREKSIREEPLSQISGYCLADNPEDPYRIHKNEVKERERERKKFKKINYTGIQDEAVVDVNVENSADCAQYRSDIGAKIINRG
jgi:hypothetical protein